MKVYFFLLLVALMGPPFINALPRQNGIEPDCSQFEDGETLPDCRSCSKYYMCVNGKALRKHCARGLYYDTMSGLCNRAFLVDCNLNRLGKEIDDVELGFGEDPVKKVQPQAVTSAPCTTTTCSTTTCTTTTCITPTATKTTCTTTTCITPTATKTTCTTTTCIAKTTPTTTCTTTTATCSKTAPTTPKKSTCSTTSPCSTIPPRTKTPPCSTIPPRTKTPPCSTTSTCTTTTPCTTTPPCTTKPPCSSTTPCATTKKSITGINAGSKDGKKAEPLQYLSSSKDCLSLPDGTILLDFNHCRRFYVCTNSLPIYNKCSVGNWFDQETRTCRPRGSVTNCMAKRN